MKDAQDSIHLFLSLYFLFQVIFFFLLLLLLIEGGGGAIDTEIRGQDLNYSCFFLSFTKSYF